MAILCQASGTMAVSVLADATRRPPALFSAHKETGRENTRHVFFLNTLCGTYFTTRFGNPGSFHFP